MVELVQVWRYEITAKLTLTEVPDGARAETERSIRARLPAWTVNLGRERNSRTLTVTGIRETEKQGDAVEQTERAIDEALRGEGLEPGDWFWKECCVRPG